MDEKEKIIEFIEDVDELVDAADEVVDAAEKVGAEVGSLLTRILNGI